MNYECGIWYGERLEVHLHTLYETCFSILGIADVVIT